MAVMLASSATPVLAQVRVVTPPIRIKPPTIKPPPISTPVPGLKSGVGTASPGTNTIRRGAAPLGTTVGRGSATPGGSSASSPPSSAPSVPLSLRIDNIGVGSQLFPCQQAGGCPCPGGGTAAAGAYCASDQLPPISCVGGETIGRTCACGGNAVPLNGVCTIGAKPPAVCSGGSIDSSGDCSCPNGNINPFGGSCYQPPTQIACNGGTFFPGGNCVCPDGTVDPVNGSCSSYQPAPISCVGGDTTSGCSCGGNGAPLNGVCTSGAKPPAVCSGGSVDGNGDCVCPNGNINPFGGNCYQPPTQIACNGGSIFANGNCACPDGTVDPISGTCPLPAPTSKAANKSKEIQGQVAASRTDGFNLQALPIGPITQPPNSASSTRPQYPQGVSYNYSGSGSRGTVTIDGVTMPISPEAEQLAREAETPPPKMWLNGQLVPITPANKMAAQEAFWNSKCDGDCSKQVLGTAIASSAQSQKASSSAAYANSVGPQYPQGVSSNESSSGGRGTVTIDGVTMPIGPGTEQLVREAETLPPKMWLNGKLVPITPANKAAAQQAAAEKVP
jgi:hypothetical protein